MDQAALRSYLTDRLAAAGVPQDAPVALAVSGGADSLALMLLMRGLRPCHVFTVDHGLRPEASAEVEYVRTLAHQYGLPVEVLRWNGGKPGGNLQAAARRARYRLLEAACRARGLCWLLTAHQQDDVAETFLMRLARGSGLKGLAAMPLAAAGLFEPSVTRLRPLLDIPRAVLAEQVTAAGLQAVSDPANVDPRFARTAVRRWLAAPPLATLDAPALAATAERLARADTALAHYCTAFLRTHVTHDQWGGVHIPLAPWLLLPQEVALRAVSAILRWIAGRAYQPRMADLAPLIAAFQADMPARTLGGVILWGADARISLYREAAAMPRAALNAGSLYDHRWILDYAGTHTALLQAAPLGTAGWAQIAGDARAEPARRALAYQARLSLPALWHDGRVVGWLGDGSGCIGEARPPDWQNTAITPV